MKRNCFFNVTYVKVLSCVTKVCCMKDPKSHFLPLNITSYLIEYGWRKKKQKVSNNFMCCKQLSVLNINLTQTPKGILLITSLRKLETDFIMLCKRKIDLISILQSSCFRQTSYVTRSNDKSNDH